MKQASVRRGRKYVLAAVAAALATAASWGGPNGPAVSAGPVKLEIRFGDGRSTFHLGEVIPIELTFSSTERRAYTISAELPPTEAEEYRIVRTGLGEDTLESGLIGMTDGGHGWTVVVDPGEKPFKVQDTLNRLFQLRIPGKYRVSITSRRLGFPVTSNTEDLEILPSDPVWEQAELARGIELIQSQAGKPGHDRGCETVRSLGTRAAELEMATLYATRGECSQEFEVGLIYASDRKAVLERLEGGLGDPARSVNERFLRTLAYVHWYQEHPERCPKLQSDPLSWRRDPRSDPDWPWAEELRYARILVASLSQKTPEARALCLETLLYLGRDLGYVEIPEEILSAVRERMPAVFAKLPQSDQEYVLRNGWPQLKSQAMIPVLRQIAEGPRQRRGAALRRLYELSPEDARPLLLQAIRSQDSHVGIDVLSILPEKELPELDGIMLERVKERFQAGGGGLVLATALAQRFATPAVAESLSSILNDGIGKMDCESEANLLAYVLRVAPRDGEAMLRKELQAGGRAGCVILRRLAPIRMSAEVEEVALDALKAPDAGIAQDALYVLQLYGSPQTREPLLGRFREWHDAWLSRAKELDNPENRERASMDLSYFTTIAAAQGWVCSKEDLRALKDLCVTENCKEEATRLIDGRRSTWFMIGFDAPVGNQVAERVWMDGYSGVIGTMGRLKQKMAQYPKGSVFKLDTRFKERALAESFYGELKPWAVERGFDLQRYPD